MLRRRSSFAALALVAPSLFVARAALAADATTPGAPVVPHPTLVHLGIEWPITGDDDLDATVRVRFREAGGSFRDGLPLTRVPAGNAMSRSWPNHFGGSLFGLRPGADYEIELSLEDPDGGSTQRTITARTRAVPGPSATARIVDVDPQNLAAALRALRAGDVLDLADGTYPDIIVGSDGTLTEPIVLRSKNPGRAIIDGEVRLDGRSHVVLTGLTIRGRVKLNDSTGVAVLGCSIETQDRGIVAYGNGSTDGTFCDNTITGPTTWREAALGVNGDNLGEGIELTGPGNVMCFNRIRGFRDCISTLEAGAAVNQRDVDVYGNDLSVCADDAIEADYTEGNARIHDNRITDSFIGISSQPGLGGPAYFVRNVMFNTLYVPFKLHNGSTGDVAYHNTVVKCGDAFAVYTTDVWSRAVFRNNLFIGGTGGREYNTFSNGDGSVITLLAPTNSSFDHDGYGSIGTGRFAGRIASTRFTSLTELRQRTTEQNAVEVDLSVFAATLSFPNDPFAAGRAPSLLLAAGSAAIDEGQVLPNINDGFVGAAPDLGAFELGASEPCYGPRGPGGCDPNASGGAGGSSGAGGTAANAGSGGVAGNAGASGDGGSAASAGNGAGGTGTAGTASGAPGSDDGGCGCRTAPTRGNAFAVLTLGALGLIRRRRRSRSIG